MISHVMQPSRRHPWVCCALLLAGCKVYDPLYCDADRPCSDPVRTYCDEEGRYPASDGIGRTCIPDPFVGGDAGGQVDAGGREDAGLDGDGGTRRSVVDLAVGDDRTCAILDDGAVRCWGESPLGYPAGTETIGDDEHPFEGGDVPTGAPVKQVVFGDDFTCFLYVAGNVRCIGEGLDGRLGYGDTQDVASTPAETPDVSLGEPARQLVASFRHACALLESGAVRCWGRVQAGFQIGPLGYGGLAPVGDNENPSDLPALDLGGAAVELSTTAMSMCAILGGADGRVRCWGADGGVDPYSLLGYPQGDRFIGDDESPGAVGDVSIGGTAIGLQAGTNSTCVLLEGGSVRCWGYGYEALGYGNTEDVGDDESPSSVPAIELGGVAVALSGGPRCALMSNADVRCWGTNEDGQLGLGSNEPLGDDERPDSVPSIDLGGQVSRLATGSSDRHQCALLENGDVRCWGLNASGQLGLGHQENIGDNEIPSDALPVRVLE